MTQEQKLERWAQREILRNINHLILEDDDGSILAFGCYDIRPESRSVAVYRDGALLNRFATRAVALSWCVAQHKNLITFGNHIEILDHQCRRVRADIRATKHMEQMLSDPDRREVLRSKIQNKQWYFNMLDSDLAKCVEKAKYLQLRGFRNETARTRPS